MLNLFGKGGYLLLPVSSTGSFADKSSRFHLSRFRLLVLFSFLASIVYLFHKRDVGRQELFENLKYAPCQLSSHLCSTSLDEESIQMSTFHPSSIHQLASETVLTIKTGSSVVWDRLVVHLASPRPDIPNRLFFSDAELHFGNVTVKDILANVSEAVREDAAFKPYEELHRSLRDRIPPQKNFNHWTLDKFKFLPLHGEAYRQFPEAKWQVSIDADTFLFWNSLLRWLSTFDHRESHYFGRVHTNGKQYWAHGGAGYVLSQGVFAETYAKDPWGFEHQWDRALFEERGGDVVLSRIMRESKGLELKGPDGGEGVFTSEPVRALVFDKDIWLSPIFTLHHLTASEVYELRRFEVKKLKELAANDYIRYCDLFEAFAPAFLLMGLELYDKGASPETNIVRRSWRAGEGNAVVYSKSFADTRGVSYDAALCETLCDENKDCFSWTFEDNRDEKLRRCVASRNAWGFGSPDDRFRSGWRLDRISRFQRKHSCLDPVTRKSTDYITLKADADAVLKKVQDAAAAATDEQKLAESLHGKANDSFPEEPRIGNDLAKLSKQIASDKSSLLK